MQKNYRVDRAVLPLNSLRAVETVLRRGNLNAAALEIGVTPGAVSQQVIKAETLLGVQLFKRVPHGLEPTATARRLATHLHDGFAELARAVALTRVEPGDRIAVSASPVFAAKWLVWRLHRFTSEWGNLKVSIEATTDFADLDSDAIDASIRVGKGNWPGTKSTRLTDIRVFPVCAPTLAPRLRIPEDLLKVPIIRDGGAWFGWNHWLAPNGMDVAQLPDGPVYSDASLCLDAAIAGQGVFLAWETLAHDAIRAGRLTAPMPGRFRTGSAYWFVENARRTRSQPVQHFLDWLLRELKHCVN
ncbi:LysR family transcriptional regulator [Martelella mediterranea]|uniref:LysR substrate-binding domain-containing protein n=1 Tax=Martelella mediterranea TaxID=293089 RepID=UPI001E3AFEB9|nr:LysR substrate-binding domain-containing protein [Martelella mediterranea]MCD1634334.1 LysR family transcriptional regulator [Martelella mediterranea]